MKETLLKLNVEESQMLTRMLDQMLREVRVEVHHTHTPNYREIVQREEKLIRSVLAKLQESSEAVVKT